MSMDAETRLAALEKEVTELRDREAGAIQVWPCVDLLLSNKPDH